ncbi:rhodanese-like domain-containing protein [Halochromatium glycolicum]|uniref:Sulfurtransferase n=1 Tax=Halochromatium glycolicum TaxID=85075 RepID=A0AAJ0U1H7_9GAMM|nr:rhodanese-like domain-containing protein [Halochromatium glycolicum]MBK1703524.1 sulfurtransferase [Halochromatium glycolicum]
MPLPILPPIALLLSLALPAQAADPSAGLFDLDALEVKITPTLPYVEVPHGEQSVLLMRHQDPAHTIVSPYQKTARPCPPYCVQPMQIAPGVETLGELELITYLQEAAAAPSEVLVIDSRTSEWVQRGTIPGSVNIPYTRLDPAYANPQQIAEILQLEFGAVAIDGLWDFANVKTLVFFCNGAWCGQSPTNIKALLGLGYPAHKLKWYRGGLQAWEQLGLTTVAPVDSGP